MGEELSLYIKVIYEHAENKKTEKELISVNLDYLTVTRGLKNSYMIMLMLRGLFIISRKYNQFNFKCNVNSYL